MTDRRRLVDGRDSRGFIATEMELYEMRLSAEALGLLGQMRHQSTVQERDGSLDGADVQAAAAYCKLSPQRVRRALEELRVAGAIKLVSGGGSRDLNYAVWSKTRAERDAERARWRGRKQSSRAAAGGQMSLPESQGDIAVTPPGNPPDGHADVTRESRHPEAEAEAEAVRGAGPPQTPQGAPNGRIDEAGDVAAYVARFAEHGRSLQPAELEFVRRIPYECPRLARSVVLAAIDDVAEKFKAQRRPMPTPVYLSARLAELQADAADRGVRPKSEMSRVGDMLPSTGGTQPVNSPEEA